jgi:hypothetical protein
MVEQFTSYIFLSSNDLLKFIDEIFINIYRKHIDLSYFVHADDSLEQ